MLMADKRSLSKSTFKTGPDQLQSWLVCLADLRNRCAHYMRLYFYNFVVTPRFSKGCIHKQSGRLFDILYVLQNLYLDKHRWTTEFVLPLKALLDEYKDVIQLDYLGFPPDWQSRLEESKTTT